MKSQRTLLTSLKTNHPWTSENIVKSPHEDLMIPNTTIPEHIWKNLDRWADKIAIICGITNYSYTYYELCIYSRMFGVKLRSHLKIRNDDVVCIIMNNCPDYAVAVLGILQAGAIVTTLNPIYTAHEIKRELLLSNPKVIISEPDTINVIKDGLHLANMDIPIIINKKNDDILPVGTIPFEDFSRDCNTDLGTLNDINRTTDDVALILYSSGTTGLPKGVELTHQNIVANCVQQDVDGFKLYEETTCSNQDSVLAVTPFYHVYGLIVAMVQKLSVGMKVVTLPKFRPSTFLSTLMDHKINLLCATPHTVLFLACYDDVKKEHLKSIKTIICAAAPVPKSDITKVLEKVEHNMDFMQIYGMTEASPLVTAMLPGSDAYTTIGFALPNTELRLVDCNLRNLGPNEAGELLIRGPQIMKGYKNNPEATKAAISEDGWLRSGDLARISEDGTVTIVDRLKYIMKVKGFQVSPAELESVLKEHPDILDAAVVGVPDVRYGEVPKAFIVLKDCRKVETQEVSNFVADRVAEYKRIKEIIILDNLPKNPSGKILKRVLKDKFSK